MKIKMDDLRQLVIENIDHPEALLARSDELGYSKATLRVLHSDALVWRRAWNHSATVKRKAS